VLVNNQLGWILVCSKMLQGAGLSRGQTDEALKVLERLPLDVNVKWSFDAKCFPTDGDGSVTVFLERMTLAPKGAYLPRFPKPKDEQWWLILGDEETGELLALKRISFRRRMSTKLAFGTPEDAGRQKMALYLMSDSYIGVDQQYELEYDCE
jgi:hypothetical protein